METNCANTNLSVTTNETGFVTNKGLPAPVSEVPILISIIWIQKNTQILSSKAKPNVIFGLTWTLLLDLDGLLGSKRNWLILE